MDRKTIIAIRKKLARWYETGARDLPWRRTRDPYAIWVSEIMLQQTRVAAVIPYYERFLARYPTAAALAAAPEQELLSMWAGLGYYSRARNLQLAARLMQGAFPREHSTILELPGVGAYTAAAVGSIAFGLPHPAVDGNVKRVVVRLANDAQADVEQIADDLLDKRNPGRWNQAMMELGATVCLPREPLCLLCPLSLFCKAHAAGTQNSLPPKRLKHEPEFLQRTLLLIRDQGRVLLVPSTRVKDFWDLPEPFSGARLGLLVGSFKHTITHRNYTFEVREAVAKKIPKGARWFDGEERAEIPLSTVARKGLKIGT